MVGTPAQNNYIWAAFFSPQQEKKPRQKTYESTIELGQRHLPPELEPPPAAPVLESPGLVVPAPGATHWLHGELAHSLTGSCRRWP